MLEKVDVDSVTDNKIDLVPVKIIVSSRVLLDRMKAISFCVSKDRNFPILQTVKIEVCPGILNLTTSDFHHTGITQIAAQTYGRICTCVPFDLLLKLLSTLPDQSLIFLIDGNTLELSIEAESGVYKFPGQGSEDWPNLPELNHELKAEIQADLLYRAFAEVLPFASGSDLTPVLGGVYVEINSSEMILCATDTQALSLRKVQLSSDGSVFSANDKSSFIVSSKVAKALAAMEREDIVNHITMVLSASFLHITGLPNELSVIAQLIDGRYPNFLHLIPEKNPYRLTVNRNNLLVALNRLEPFANSGTKRIRLDLSGENMVHILAEDFENNKQAKENVPVIYDGINLQIGFSLNHLRHALEAWSMVNIRLELSSSSRAGVVRDASAPDEDPNLVLVMPFSLDN
jgi:DNA polymerase-3 subunit beta